MTLTRTDLGIDTEVEVAGQEHGLGGGGEGGGVRVEEVSMDRHVPEREVVCLGFKQAVQQGVQVLAPFTWLVYMEMVNRDKLTAPTKDKTGIIASPKGQKTEGDLIDILFYYLAGSP